jgi:hypothetical protein
MFAKEDDKLMSRAAGAQGSPATCPSTTTEHSSNLSTSTTYGPVIF